MGSSLNAPAFAVQQLDNLNVLGLHDLCMQQPKFPLLLSVLSSCPRALQGLCVSFERENLEANVSSEQATGLFECIAQFPVLESLVLPQLDWFLSKHFLAVTTLQKIEGLTVHGPCTSSNPLLRNLSFHYSRMFKPYDQETIETLRRSRNDWC